MTIQQWSRVETLFHDALGIRPSERDRFLRDREDDQSVLIEVKRLLDSHETDDEFISPLALPETPPPNLDDLLDGDPEPALEAGTLVGGYTIRRLVGTGGMGTVYEAIQSQPERSVALKIMAGGIASPRARRRFEYEAEVLGRLRHPSVAQVYEAGIHRAADGSIAVPFFAMEFIPDAVALTDYVTSRGLDQRRRLELFLCLCDAVHHGHQRGVLHRDLKPSNVLVDASGRLKVIDFGVARIMHAGAPDPTMCTHVGQMVGTLQYMSPEQVGADPSEVDTQSDVYALGMILHELLVDRLPYDVRGCALPEAVAIIRDQAPTSLRRIDSSIDPDLDTIVATALHKDRAVRYSSVSELVQDIRHALRHEPIAARPPTIAYQARLFTRRHRGLVTSFGLIVLVLTLGMAGTVWGLVEANRGRDAADIARKDALAEAERAGRVSAFLESVLAYGGRRSAAREYTMEDVLHEVAARVDVEFRSEPEVEYRIRESLAKAFSESSAFDAAREQYETAMQLSRSLYGPGAESTLCLGFGLADTLAYIGDVDEADRLLMDLSSEFESSASDSLEILLRRGNVRTAAHAYSDARTILEEAYEACRRSQADPLTTAAVLESLGQLEQAERRNTEAIARFERALTIRRTIQGASARPVGVTLAHMAGAYADRNEPGDLESGEGLLREAIDLMERIDVRDFDRIWVMRRLAFNLERQERFEEAATMFEQTLELGRILIGEEHAELALTRHGYADVLVAMGRLDEAETEYRAAIRTMERRVAPDHWMLECAREDLATLLGASSDQ